MLEQNRQFIFASRPVGYPKESDFNLVSSPIPTPGDGEVLIHTCYLSVDPYMRGRMRQAKSYAALPRDWRCRARRNRRAGHQVKITPIFTRVTLSRHTWDGRSTALRPATPFRRSILHSRRYQPRSVCWVCPD